MLDTESNFRFIQFALWKDCRNHCKFCFDKGLKDIDKIESLTFVIDKLKEHSIYQFNEIGFIGGEFFDNQLENENVRKLFYTMFELVYKLEREKVFEKIYITTSLIFKDPKYIIEFFDIAKSHNCLDKFLLCTSYDTLGRFHTNEHLQYWKNNMLLLHRKYPELKLHTETIVTQDFINKVLLNEFDIKQFQTTYSTTVDYLEPNTGSYYDGKVEFDKNVPNFLPTRTSFLKFLKKTCIEDKSIELFKLFSKKIRSDMLYLINGSEHIEIKGRRNAGRLLGLTMKILPRFGYIDSEIDMLDDVNALRSCYEQ